MPDDTVIRQAITDVIHTRVREAIARVGYDVINVFGEPDVPTFSYTVGLTGRGHPELFMAGMQPSLMQSLLRAATEQAGSLRDGMLVERVAQVPLAVRQLPQEPTNRQFLRIAEGYYGHPVEALQLVVPDARGLFPWQRGCDPTMVKYQSAILAFAGEQEAMH